MRPAPTPTDDNGAAASHQVHRPAVLTDAANQELLWSPLSPETGGGDREPDPDRAQRHRRVTLGQRPLFQARGQAQLWAHGAALEAAWPFEHAGLSFPGSAGSQLRNLYPSEKTDESIGR